jgi:DNA-binding NtrC family response regulator
VPGALDYITKPFRREQILLTVEKAMKWRRLLKENQALKAELRGPRRTMPKFLDIFKKEKRP